LGFQEPILLKGVKIMQNSLVSLLGWKQNGKLSQFFLLLSQGFVITQFIFIRGQDKHCGFRNVSSSLVSTACHKVCSSQSQPVTHSARQLFIRSP